MFSFFNLFGSNSNSNPALNHLELVLSKKKKLKEKNLGKYYRALGGNYKIDYNKSLHDSYKLFKLGVKNNINVHNLVNKFKGSAPKLYSKLERRIRKKYLKGGSESDDDDDNSNDSASVITNLSGMSDVPADKGYSPDNLPDYAKLDPQFFKIYDPVDPELIKKNLEKFKETIQKWSKAYNVDPKYIDSSLDYAFKISHLPPNEWNLQEVLKYFLSSYKASYGNKFWMYSPHNLIIHQQTYKDKYDKDKKFTENRIISAEPNPKFKFDPEKEYYESVKPDETLSKLFGRDGLLLGMYDDLLKPTKKSHDLIQYLLYWFYYAGSGKTILERTGWTKVDKENGNKIIFNPTAGLLMRLIEVLHYINVRYLYPQCVLKFGKCDPSACKTEYANIVNKNNSFLMKLEKLDLEIQGKIKKKMTRGLYSTVFRKHFGYVNFNDKKLEHYKNQLEYKLESCETILARGLDSIYYTYNLMGGIKDRRYDYRGHEEYRYHNGGHEEYRYYDGGHEESRYHNGGQEDYRDYDGGQEDYDYNTKYYPDSMHGGALGLFRSEINRII